MRCAAACLPRPKRLSPLGAGWTHGTRQKRPPPRHAWPPMLLLPPPPRIPSSGESLRGLPKRETGSGLRSRTRATALYINKGFPTLFNTPDTLCSHVPPPDRVYMYSLEIALRLAHIRKIHLYFSTHRSLSARCDPPRVSCIPPRARAATCIAPNAPRGPHSSMTTCRAVCLCDHVC